MNKFGATIRNKREASGLLLRQLAAKLEIDTAMLSKIERGERNAKRSQVSILAEILKLNEEELLTYWLADKVYEIVKYDEVGCQALKVAEKEFEYSKTKNR
ncbi:MAG: helix-turn-helix transcriptional regulator [Bacteroidota bacterium]